MARIARTPQRPVRARNMIDLRANSVPRPRGLGPSLPQMLPPVAVARRAGELVLQPHLKTPAGRALMSLLAATRVAARTVTKIAVSANLLPVTLPMAVGAAEALAVAAQVDLVALGAPMGEEARFLGNGTINTGSC